ncbi:pyridoxal phosphate-dependent transferase [Penicillium antarcticum]|uniref:pyridoxal phosphate-dependent transferase n=1 Tax=Penicillium antarcticum TaxID=416450 RepID=UPI002399CB84|nr:pyridoxal phosphate-dependent transferase [Penicillium antarcticum]KAJ5316802.1 pyridoxal phosphate-dependent transferase [Penicillium antarcticum]
MKSISELPNVHANSMFSTLPETPLDEPFSVNGAYKQDCDPKKVNLGIGVYRTSDGSPWPLRVVEEAERKIYETNDVNRHEYTAISGDPGFLSLAADLVFGFGEEKGVPTSVTELERRRVVSIQTVSGTGANRLGAELLARNVRPGCVWIPDPTWANHYTIWDLAGVPKKRYPYYDATRKTFDFDGTFRTLSTSTNKNDVVILHACAHNPTGADPTKEQWKILAQLCEEKGIIPFFDLAYQGFASGDAKKDAWAIRHFFHNVHQVEFCVAQSFSKNFGLYGQRVGSLHMVLSSTATRDVPEKVLANLCHLVRGEYSMAPRGGAEIVKTVLGNEDLREKWLEDLTTMSERIQNMRHALFNELIRLGTPGDWTHVTNQIGMFTYVGLTESQVHAITERHHVYMLKSGRISISGMNENNVQYVAMAIDDVIRTVE